MRRFLALGVIFFLASTPGMAGPNDIHIQVSLNNPAQSLGGEIFAASRPCSSDPHSSGHFCLSIPSSSLAKFQTLLCNRPGIRASCCSSNAASANLAGKTQGLWGFFSSALHPISDSAQSVIHSISGAFSGKNPGALPGSAQPPHSQQQATFRVNPGRRYSQPSPKPPIVAQEVQLPAAMSKPLHVPAPAVAPASAPTWHIGPISLPLPNPRQALQQGAAAAESVIHSAASAVASFQNAAARAIENIHTYGLPNSLRMDVLEFYADYQAHPTHGFGWCAGAVETILQSALNMSLSGNAWELATQIDKDGSYYHASKSEVGRLIYGLHLLPVNTIIVYGRSADCSVKGDAGVGGYSTCYGHVEIVTNHYHNKPTDQDPQDFAIDAVSDVHYTRHARFSAPPPPGDPRQDLNEGSLEYIANHATNPAQAGDDPYRGGVSIFIPAASRSLLPQNAPSP